MPDPPLHIRLYAEAALYDAARIIGYGGIEMAHFWAQAKKLELPQEQLPAAVHDLTRTDRREEDPPRYQLTAPARKACFQLLGPPPEHPWHRRLVKGPPLGSEEELRQWRQRVEAQDKPAGKRGKGR
jgi:hypothetical protein